MDKQRNVQNMERNVKPRTDTDAPLTDQTSQKRYSEVGAMMSQRKPANREILLSSVVYMKNETVPVNECKRMSCELDTHVDTCCFGKGAHMMSIYHNSCAEVSGFSSQLGTVKSVPIMTAAVAYDCPDTHQTYILIFHQSLYIDDLNSQLICPNHLRSAGVLVNDCPLQFIPLSNQAKYSHTVQTGQLRICLKLRGVISYFNISQPTQKDINDDANYP
jgi:hypothetical protein